MSSMINIHISLTPFKNESRVLKQTKSLICSRLFDKIYILALHENDLPIKEISSPNIEVLRIKLISRSLSKGIPSQLIKYLELSYRIFKFTAQVRPNVVNIHGLPLLPLGCLMKFFLGIKLVYDTHELETETDGLVGIRQTFARMVEKLFIKFVDATVVVGGQIKNWYLQKYNIKNIETVMNCPHFVKNEKLDLIRDELNIEKSRKIILYLGGISEGRGIRFLLESFHLLENHSYALVFIGYGDLVDLIKSYREVNEHIFLRNAVSPNDVIKYAASADIGISIIADNCLSYKFCLPNKLFEYIMAGIPSIISDLPEMKQIVENYEIGVAISGNDYSEFHAALVKLELTSKEKMKENLKNAAKVLNWENQERYYIDTMQKVLDKLKN